MLPREKENFYRSLAQLLRAGVPFPSALGKLVQTTRGPLRSLTKKLQQALSEGHRVGEAFAKFPSLISPLEAGIIDASERSGALDRGFTQLALYFETLARARDTIRRKLAYPAFMLHFGVLLMALPTFVTDGAAAYLRQTGPALAVTYMLAVGALLLLGAVRDAGSSNTLLDRFLRAIPLFGKVRTNFAHARFCLIYGLQLEAGINAFDSLHAAGLTSRSGLIQKAIGRVVEDVRHGSQVGASLAQSQAFPDALTRAVIVGEESGELDAELTRLADEYQGQAVSDMENATEWSAKLIYIAVLLFLGFRIVWTYREMLRGYEKLLDF